MEILNDFGFDPILLAAQIVNFLVILYLLKRFLLKPVLITIKKRQDNIEKGLLQAEEGRKILEESQVKEREILTKAKEQAEKIVNDGRTRASKVAVEIEGKAKRDSEKILADSREIILKERKETELELEEQSTRLAMVVLQKSIEKLLGKREQEIIMNKALKELKNNE